jgi:hypothetical protein
MADIYKSEWRQYASCLNIDTELFTDPELYDQGKKFCDVCPVKVECLDNAMNFNDGMLRGGMSEKERNSVEMHRKRHLASFRYDFCI